MTSLTSPFLLVTTTIVRLCLIFLRILTLVSYPIGSMYAIYGNIYHQYTPNVSIYTIHGSYGYLFHTLDVCKHHGPTLAAHRAPSCRLLPSNRLPEGIANIQCHAGDRDCLIYIYIYMYIYIYIHTYTFYSIFAEILGIIPGCPRRWSRLLAATCWDPSTTSPAVVPVPKHDLSNPSWGPGINIK